MHKLCLEREEFWYKGLQLEQVNTGEGERPPPSCRKVGPPGLLGLSTVHRPRRGP